MRRPDYTMIIKDETVDCQRKGFILYGQQSVPDDTTRNTCTCGSSGTNGLYKCVGEQSCQALCYSVYAKTYNVTDGLSWKFCEVEIY